MSYISSSPMSCRFWENCPFQKGTKNYRLVMSDIRIRSGKLWKIFISTLIKNQNPLPRPYLSYMCNAALDVYQDTRTLTEKMYIFQNLFFVDFSFQNFNFFVNVLTSCQLVIISQASDTFCCWYTSLPLIVFLYPVIWLSL